MPNNSDLMILLTAAGIAGTHCKKRYFRTAALNTAAQCASRIAGPNALASQVTDDTFHSSRQSQTHRKHGYLTKQQIGTPAKRRILFLPIQVFLFCLCCLGLSSFRSGRMQASAI
jgi:hypothetical protein